MPHKNKNFNKAKAVKNNEFFTRATDIQKELQHYWKHFKNKMILLNCNDNEDSEFWKYFKALFKVIGLRKLVAISYGENAVAYEYDGYQIKKTKLNGNGDFRDPECIQYLRESDVVVTNPPFTLYKEFIDQLMKFNKKFLIIGLAFSYIYAAIFPFVKDQKMWVGFTRHTMSFKTKNKEEKQVATLWYTNLGEYNNIQYIVLTKKYSPKEYPKFDNYNAIYVNRIRNIPKDYFDLMGVPVNFIYKWNLNQFKLIETGVPYLNNKRLYQKVFIKRRINAT